MCISAYKTRFKADPGAYSANAYAAANIIIVAISKAISVNNGAAPGRAQVLKNVADTKNFPTPVGTIGFDRYGDTTGPILSLYKVENSKVRFVNQIDLRN